MYRSFRKYLPVLYFAPMIPQIFTITMLPRRHVQNKVNNIFEMNSTLNKWFSPAQVFAQFTSDEGKSSSSLEQRRKLANISKNEVLATLPEIIQIFESGEVTLVPDLAKVIIVCSNTKVRLIFKVWIRCC